jgi:hypothetical protein
MFPVPPVEGCTRSAAEINAQIRALWTGPGGHPALPLSAEQRAEYHQLLAELREVEREDVAKAA